MSFFVASIDAQRSLSKMQMLPIVGPVVFSPIKAVWSIAQIIAGFAATVILGLGAPFIKGWDEAAWASLGIVGVGVVSLGYSILNMTTLGIAGLIIEISLRTELGV